MDASVRAAAPDASDAAEARGSNSGGRSAGGQESHAAGSPASSAQAQRAAPASTDASVPTEPAPSSAVDGGAASDASANSATFIESPTACAPFTMPADCARTGNSTLPNSLDCAGLYANLETATLACGLTEYAPAYELWSDGAVKRRWVSLPAGATVDMGDPDAFVFPVGTEFWKEFRVAKDGQQRRAETRLLRKVERGWVLATYVWSEDGRSATLTNDGDADWEGSGHTIPSRDQCVECHAGRKDLVLGWDPVLLGPGARGIQLADLIGSAGPDDDAGVAASDAMPPGDAIEQAALGYLHVNCGVSCHNDSIDARARDTALYLRLSTGRADSVLETPAVTSAINKLPTGNAPFYELPAPDAGVFYDLLPGSSERSLMLARMLVRDHPAQMPPLASNEVDESGTAAVAAWIERMTPERGYPAPAP
jgi:hypothetical protein